MKKIFNVEGWESETPISFVTKSFDSKEAYESYINDPNHEPFVVTTEEECETVKDKVIMGVRKGLGFLALGLVVDACSGFSVTKLAIGWMKKRKLKKKLKKLVKEHPEYGENDFVEIAKNYLDEDEVRKIIKEVRG